MGTIESKITMPRSGITISASQNLNAEEINEESLITTQTKQDYYSNFRIYTDFPLYYQNSFYLRILSHINNLQIPKIINKRNTAELNETIIGALKYLNNTQIRERPGRQSSLYDYCGDDGEGCERRVLITNPLNGQMKEISAPESRKIKNNIGEWVSVFHPVPKILGNKNGESIVAIQDSNVFTTVSILQPLYMFDDSTLPENERFISKMRTLAILTFKDYKRGNAYSFWQEREGETSSFPKIGPLNLTMRNSEILGKLYIGYYIGLGPTIAKLIDYFVDGFDIPKVSWIKRLIDKDENISGFDASYNIPNDADDTSLIVAAQRTHQIHQQYDNIIPDINALNAITNFRDDENRNKSDSRIKWKQGRTGSYLTWIKDENEPVFSDPNTGIIPLGINNVDCVVNANVLFSLAINDEKTANGFKEATKLMEMVAENQIWDSCSFYYPQSMTFPYSFSRAYRDGNIHTPEMQRAADHILEDLINSQNKSGSFPGGKDKIEDLSTAQGVVSLLNLGIEVARRNNLEYEYNKAIKSGIDYLWKRKMCSITNSSNELICHWQSGLFFSGSYKDLAHWRSIFYTTAIVLEAITKYVTAFDYSDDTILDKPKIQILKY